MCEIVVDEGVWVGGLFFDVRVLFVLDKIGCGFFGLVKGCVIRFVIGFMVVILGVDIIFVILFFLLLLLFFFIFWDFLLWFLVIFKLFLYFVWNMVFIILFEVLFCLLINGDVWWFGKGVLCVV